MNIKKQFLTIKQLDLYTDDDDLIPIDRNITVCTVNKMQKNLEFISV